MICGHINKEMKNGKKKYPDLLGRMYVEVVREKDKTKIKVFILIRVLLAFCLT